MCELFPKQQTFKPSTFVSITMWDTEHAFHDICLLILTATSLENGFLSPSVLLAMHSSSVSGQDLKEPQETSVLKLSEVTFPFYS